MSRLPAEWEPQSAVVLAWPDDLTDWCNNLTNTRQVYLNIIQQLLANVDVVLLIRASEVSCFSAQYQPLVDQSVHTLELITCQFNDTWVRDYGPLTMVDADNKCTFLDFRFNAWGGKFNSALDDAANATLCAHPRFQNTPIVKRDFILEGGSIESDGAGNILTTKQCLLNNNRNPGKDKTTIENELKESLSATNILWLDQGLIIGDDTDNHIDTLARFAPNNTLVYQSCDDKEDVHYDVLQNLKKALERFRSHAKFPFRLIDLPLPSAKLNSSGERLPATYVNYLVTNNVVLAPIYQDKSDARALKLISKAYPKHEIIGIDCLALIEQGGSLHCITMQLPKNSIAPKLT